MYNDDARDVLISSYVYKGSENLTLEKTYRLLLDKDGRIVDNYYEVYFPKRGRQVSKEVNSTRAAQKESSHQNVKYESQDKKGNITLSYALQAQTESSVYSNNYYEQSIVYYDGTVSEGGEIEKYIEGGGFVIPTLKKLELEGSVKTLKRFSYDDGDYTWDEQTQKVILKDVYSEEVFDFDQKGALVNKMEYTRIYGTQRLEKDAERSFKYDDKFRITSDVITLYYNNNAHTIYDTEVVYDDVAKTASYKVYRVEKGERVLITNEVYKLAADGTVSLSNYDIHATEGVKLRIEKRAQPSHKEQPNETHSEIIKKDKSGNWTEDYSLSKYFEYGEFSYATVNYYVKREISYY